MSGVGPLTYTTIRHYRKEMGVPRLDPQEVEALIVIDSILCFPGDETTEAT